LAWPSGSLGPVPVLGPVVVADAGTVELADAGTVVVAADGPAEGGLPATAEEAVNWHHFPFPDAARARTIACPGGKADDVPSGPVVVTLVVADAVTDGGKVAVADDDAVAVAMGGTIVVAYAGAAVGAEGGGVLVAEAGKVLADAVNVVEADAGKVFVAGAPPEGMP
jgi:hypothetical protein